MKKHYEIYWMMHSFLTHSGLSNGTKEWLSNGTTNKSIARDAALHGLEDLKT
jgi:hypothetical protein